MTGLSKKKSSEEIFPLKIKYNSIILVFGYIAINYLILPYVRTNQNNDIYFLQGFVMSMYIGTVLHIILISYYISKKHISIRSILLIWGIVVLAPELFFRFLYWQATIISLPDTLCRITTVLLTCCFFVTPKPKVRILIATLFSIVFLTFLSGWSLWINKLSFNTFTGRIEKEQMISKIEFTDKGDKLQIETLYSEYILLYMWITNCGYCFESFPQLQSIYNEFRKSPYIQIYAVHSWTNQENEETGKIELDKRGYTFPCLSIPYKDPFLSASQVTVYPTVLILNSKKELLFRGNLNKAINYIKELVDQR